MDGGRHEIELFQDVARVAGVAEAQTLAGSAVGHLEVLAARHAPVGLLGATPDGQTGSPGRRLDSRNAPPPPKTAAPTSVQNHHRRNTEPCSTSPPFRGRLNVQCDRPRRRRRRHRRWRQRQRGRDRGARGEPVSARRFAGNGQAGREGRGVGRHRALELADEPLDLAAVLRRGRGGYVPLVEGDRLVPLSELAILDA
jgi:hypothetical protein